ncbi:winged helix-turn-helix transcriptional regulator [Pelomonas sp. V22]|uniref:carbohydrate kinase family protein n=1 Tax=Pelomonas sp. V22 TaxID=2822139 RepID=UPI0024A9CBE8|nr:carbohydrate kinase [Pelomonas sp. V22]MDI4633181.1 winged helix-turn-helix transcriptional regulator [Pelomonas sp. V22]
MPSKKEQLLELIRNNPFISQQDLAQQLGLSRSAVAGHIAALTRERQLLGRAYILPQRSPLLCIGGANIDRKLSSLSPIRPGTSNPARLVKESPGGVARNIAENLARLGLPVQLLTAVGLDATGQGLLAQAQAAGLDTSGSLQIADAATGSYTAVLDADGQMLVALAHMELAERLSPDFLRSTAAQRAQARMLIADLNLPAESLALLLAEAHAAGQPTVLVAVSEPKMDRLPEQLQGLRCLVLNLGELEALIGAPMKSATARNQALAALRERGLQDLVITQGRAGLLYSRPDGRFGSLAAPPTEVLDVTGAGDAFAAGLCHGLDRDPEDLEAACHQGLRLAALTLQTTATVHPDLSPTTLD